MNDSDKKATAAPSKLFKRMLLIIVPVAIIISGATALLCIPKVQFEIASRLMASRGLSLEAFSFSFKPGAKSAKILISNAKFKKKDDNGIYGFKNIEFALDYYSLLKSEAWPQYISISEPEVILESNDDKNEKPFDLEAFKGILAGLYLPGNFRSFSVVNAKIISGENNIDGLTAHIYRRDDSPETATFEIESSLGFKNIKTEIKSSGKISFGDGGVEAVTASLSFGKIPVTAIPWPESFRGTSGSISSEGLDLNWEKNGSFTVKGSLSLPESGFMLDAYNELKSYNLSGCSVMLEAELLENALDIRQFEISGKDFRLSSSCYLPKKDGRLIGMSLSVRSTMMPMERFKKLYPSPVTPTWIGQRLLPLFSGGRAKLSDLLIEGSFDRISGLDKKEHAAGLFLDIDLDSIDIGDFGGNLESKGVSANVVLDKGRLVVSKVNGEIGSSVISDATYDYVDTYAEKSIENWFLKGRFTMPDLHIISKSGISPTYVRKNAESIIGANGWLEGDISFSYHPDWKFIKIESGRFSSAEAGFVHPDLEFPVSLKKMKIGFDSKGSADISSFCQWGRSSADIKGKADILNGDLKVAGRGMLSSDDITALLEKGEGVGTAPVLKGTQKTDFLVTAKNWKIKADFSSDLGGFACSFAGYSIPPLEKNSVLHLSLSGSLEEAWKLDRFDLVLGNGTFSLALPKNLKSLQQFSFSMRDFDIGRLGIMHDESVMSFSGRLDGDILVRRLSYGGFYPGVFGEINARDIGIKMPGLPLENKGTGRILFSGQRIYTDKLRLGIGESTIDISADLRGWKGLRGKIGIKSKDLVLPKTGELNPEEDILPYFDSDFAMNSDLEISLDIESGMTGSRMKFGKTTSSCLFKNGRFDVKDGRIALEGGEIRFRLNQPSENRRSVNARVYMNLSNQRLKSIFANIGEEKSVSRLNDAILSTSAFIHCFGKNKKELISTLGGYVNLGIKDGVLKKSSVIFSILSMLNLERIVHERPEGISKEGFYFSDLNAGFKIENGVLTTHDLVIKSPIINLGAAGEFDLKKRTMSLDMVAAPLVTIDSVISNLPFVGYILTGKDRALLSYYFKVRGPFESPETSYVPLKDIPRSIYGYLQRIFLTPGRIPEELSDMKGLIIERD